MHLIHTIYIRKKKKKKHYNTETMIINLMS